MRNIALRIGFEGIIAHFSNLKKITDIVIIVNSSGVREWWISDFRYAQYCPRELVMRALLRSFRISKNAVQLSVLHYFAQGIDYKWFRNVKSCLHMKRNNALTPRNNALAEGVIARWGQYCALPFFSRTESLYAQKPLPIWCPSTNAPIIRFWRSKVPV